MGMNTDYVDYIQGKYSCILNPSVILNSSLILNPCLIGALIITHTIFGVPYCNYSIGPQTPNHEMSPQPRPRLGLVGLVGASPGVSCAAFKSQILTPEL